MRLIYKKILYISLFIVPYTAQAFNFWGFAKKDSKVTPSQLENIPFHNDEKIRKKVDVRVLLASFSFDSGESELVFESPNGFLVYDPTTRAGFVYSNSTLTLQIKKNVFYLNNKKIIPNQFILKPRDFGCVTFQGNEYHGFFKIEKSHDACLVVNVVDLEEYVFSVLNSESWPGWPLEINKAFAIACRSYVMHKIYQSLNRKSSYDIKNTNIHQTYNGVHGSKQLRQAVQETEGLILTYDGKPIDAMFDSCCGGIVPARMSGIDFKKFPYLQRENQCGYCKSCKIYAWRLTYPINEFEKLLHNAGHSIKKIQSIKVIKKDSAGIVERVVVKGAHYNHYLTGKQLYSLCSQIKSFCFTVSKQRNMITFIGRGYGHHLGICQWGAKKMFDMGHHYRSILSFYYPSTRMQRLKA